VKKLILFLLVVFGVALACGYANATVYKPAGEPFRLSFPCPVLDGNGAPLVDLASVNFYRTTNSGETDVENMTLVEEVAIVSSTGRDENGDTIIARAEDSIEVEGTYFYFATATDFVGNETNVSLPSEAGVKDATAPSVPVGTVTIQ